MTLYRVFPYDRSAALTEWGGALFVPPSTGRGRIDNALYDTLYTAKIAEAAIAESFGRLAIWRPDSFVNGSGHPYALASYDAPPDLETFNLNDIGALLSIGITRPTDIVTRDRATTQAWAATIFDLNRYSGAEWWSYYNPDWPVVGLWDCSRITLIGLPEIITAASPVVESAAAAIVRQITT